MRSKQTIFNTKTGAMIIVFFALIVFFAFMMFMNVHTVNAAGPPPNTPLQENQHWWSGTLHAIGGALKKGAMWALDATAGNVMKFAAWLIFKLFSIGLVMSGFLLDTSITFSLSSAHFNLPAVHAGWVTVRDFANLFFIFIMLYIAIATILNMGNYKQALLKVIVGAVLINFSLFFTRVIIDAGNILAVGFYNEASEITIDSGGGPVTGHSISSVFMSGFQLQTMMDSSQYDHITNFDAATAYIWGTIGEAVAMFVFFAAALMFVGRTVTLIFLMVLSPLAFVAMVLPGTKGYATKWWRALIDQTFFAPAFLFLILIVAKIIKSGNLINITGSGGGSFANMLNLENVSDAAMMLTYVLLCGLLLGSLMVAKSMGGTVASTSIKWAKKSVGPGKNSYLRRGARQVNKHTTGRAASRIANSQTLKNFGMDHPTMGRMADSALGAVGAKGFEKWEEDKKKVKEAYGRKIATRNPTRKERADIDTARGSKQSASRLYVDATKRRDEALDAWTKDEGNTELQHKAELAEQELVGYKDMVGKADKREGELREGLKIKQATHSRNVRNRMADSLERSSTKIPTTLIGKVVHGVTNQARINWDTAQALRKEKGKKEELEDTLKEMLKSATGDASTPTGSGSAKSGATTA